MRFDSLFEIWLKLLEGVPKSIIKSFKTDYEKNWIRTEELINSIILDGWHLSRNSNDMILAIQAAIEILDEFQKYYPSKKTKKKKEDLLALLNAVKIHYKLKKGDLSSEEAKKEYEIIKKHFNKKNKLKRFLKSPFS